MPDYKPNQFVRAFAVIALVAALIAVVAVVVISSGDSGGDGGGGGGGAKVENEQSKRGRQAVEKGRWIVRSGDTLAKISEETGVDVDTLIQLNPDLDPQALPEGQRVALR